MNFSDFMSRVRESGIRMGLESPLELAMMMAMAHLESKARNHDGPTSLASIHNNLFGIHWIEGDEHRGYARAVLPANEFEGGGVVAYRAYQSLEHCMENWIWHRDQSSYYSKLKDLMLAKLAGGENPENVYAEWTRRMEDIWQEGNATAGEHADILYWAYLGRLQANGEKVKEEGDLK